MFLAEKSPRSYVGLYQKFLYKSFSLLLTPPPPPNNYFHTSPDATTAASGPRITVFCDPQEDAHVCSGQCAFPKRPADAAIGQSPCDASTPSDTLQPFIRICFIIFRELSRVYLPLCQEVCGPTGVGSS